MACRMYDEQQAIIREIVAFPNDDGPRLIYADWLEERGDPQGEFIRVQCALAAGVADPVRAQELRARELEMLREYREEWVARICPGGVEWHQISRGLVEDVVIDCDQFFRDEGVLLANSPVVGLGLKLRSLDDAQRLAQLPTFAQLSRLRLGDSVLGDAGLATLVRSPYAPRLFGLWLSRCQIGLAGIQALAASSVAERLDTLFLVGNPLTDAGATMLHTEPVFRQIRSIKHDYGQYTVGPGGAVVSRSAQRS